MTSKPLPKETKALGTKESKSIKRQMWLERALRSAIELYRKAGVIVPANTRLSWGWTKGRGKQKHLAECWDKVASHDGHFEIFVDPSLGHKGRPSQEVSLDIILAIVHELGHAVAGATAKHGPVYKGIVTKVGLGGKMAHTPWEDSTPEFKTWAKGVVETIGNFPAAAIREGGGGKKEKKGSRLLKCQCATCGYTARITRKWIDEAGTPICPTCDEPFGCDTTDDEEDEE